MVNQGDLSQRWQNITKHCVRDPLEADTAM